MAQRYPYLPLNASEHQIRLLTLFPEEFPSPNEAVSPIEIQFQTISFEAASSQVGLRARYGWRNTKRLVKPVRRPKYEALSYAWGEEKSPTPVLVKSHGSKRKFVEVTQNLATALIYLRHKSEARVLWIDALCINQEDMEERSSQVARMADIYRLAHRVVVWLGPESEVDRSSEALSTLRGIGSHIEVDWSTYEIRATNEEDSSWADTNIPLALDQHSLSSLLMVINRPWFERIWVQQEIALANEHAVLICGHDSITRRHFMNALFCIRSKRLESYWELGKLFRDRVELIYEMVHIIYNPNTRPLEQTLRSQARNLKCLDPRDRIFAVLSTRAPWDKEVSIEVDYSKTTEEVYRQFAVKQIMYTNNLDLLTACQGKTKHEGIHNPMQSWVPDWRRPLVTEPLISCFTSGRSAAAAQFDCKLETLTVSGVKCATVAQVQHAHLGLRSRWKYQEDDFINDLQRSIQFWGLSEWYVTGETVHDAHVRTLCGNYFSDSVHPSSSNFLTYEICSSKIEQFLQKCAVDEIENLTEQASTSKLMARILNTCRERSCFTTTEGYIGLAPRETKSGDIICVLLGSYVPFVLRSQGEEKYSVVGECYCHGITDGSALLGPLPAGFEIVRNLVQDRKGYFRAFIDRRSGKVQGEDPRLARYPLPPRWRIETLYKGAVVEFVQDNDDGTEKQRTWRFDPRMTPDELRKRGVNVVKFDLT